MNYYEKHLGDYLKNAAHLTLLEHGVYSRLLDVYYVHEAPIPADKAARLIAARTDEELQALQIVLQEFFELQEDGCWHQSRCDEDVAAYHAGEPEREAKKANELTRLQRHREERSKLFKVLTDAGVHLAWNVPIGDLRAAVSRVAGSPDAPVIGETKATATATPATATQTPDTRHQSPDTIPQVGKTRVPETSATADPVTPTRAGSACLALRRAGVPDGNTSHPTLLALLALGVTDAELSDAAAAVPESKRKFAYVLGVVKGRRNDAATVGTLPAPPPPASRAARHAEVRRALGIPDNDQEVIDAKP